MKDQHNYKWIEVVTGMTQEHGEIILTTDLIKVLDVESDDDKLQRELNAAAQKLATNPVEFTRDAKPQMDRATRLTLRIAASDLRALADPNCCMSPEHVRSALNDIAAKLEQVANG